MARDISRLDELADEFWTWRVANVPDSFDDVPRVERPEGWVSDWSPQTIADRRDAARWFGERYRALDLSGEPVPAQVDARLLGCALDRVHWELELLRSWERNPCFYLDQSLVPVYNLLLAPPPFDRERAETIIEQLRHVPDVLSDAQYNLAGRTTSATFACRALTLLTHADTRLRDALAALEPFLPEPARAALPAVAERAVAAVAGYRTWLQQGVTKFIGPTEVGAEAFTFFLHRVAMLPYGVPSLREMGRQEWERAVAMEAVLRRRLRGEPDLPLPASSTLQVVRQHADELDMRRFYEERGLLDQPDTLRHYHFETMPAYLEPLTWLGVPHDITSQSRRDENAVRWIREPRPDLPYFQLADAKDPRNGIIHEGVHAQQLALSWRHPDPVRRHYYDSAANEGIAFYHEELMFLSGLYDDAPASAWFVANAMRLRALRVEIDVGMAVGDLTLAQAATELAQAVPMDLQTAWEEATFFAGNPGQGLSYQIGKLQILDLITSCARDEGDDFDLQDFHNRLWQEGNIPLVLQRWELLGRRDQLDRADALASARSRPES